MDFIKLLQYLMLGFLGIFTGLFIAAVIYYLSRQNQSNLSTIPVIFTPLFGRKKEILRLRGQILTGQSSAIVSVFEEERTALLGYLSDPSNGKDLYRGQAGKLVFSLLDIHLLFLKEGVKECKPSQFWERALKPLEDKLESNSSLFESYQACKENQFDEHYLDRLIVQLKQEGWHLVLMLDRFDELLNSNLYKQAFFAILRILASSRFPSSLSLIISGSISLKQFHEKTKDLNPKGSPYFNFMESGEIVLKALSETEADELLRQTGFSKQECQFIKEMTGRHPYFMQHAVSTLQTAKENQEEQPLEVAKNDFYNKVANLLTNIMLSWDLEVCKTVVALVKGKKVPEFFNEELSLLVKQGFLLKDSQNQWQVSPPVLVDFIKNTEQELCKH
jgi:hypothetical protein